MMSHAWAAYERFAWGENEVRPELYCTVLYCLLYCTVLYCTVLCR